MSPTPDVAARTTAGGPTSVGRTWIAVLVVLSGSTLYGCGASKADNIKPQTVPENPPQQLVWRGVPLGEFHIQHTRPLENLKLVLSFDLTASVGETNEAHLAQLVAARKHRLRDQVIVAVRAAPTIVFDEPELIDLRRRIHLRVQEVLAGIEIADIYLTNFDCQID